MTNFNYSKLKHLEEFFHVQISEKELDLSQMVLVACQHLLEPQKVMMESLIELGFLPENIFVLGKVYSTNNEVLEEINRLGITAMQPAFNPQVSFDVQHKENCEQLWKLSETKRASCNKVVVLDDGGAMLETVMVDGQAFVGIEQTSSGFRKLENKEIAAPIFNVARSRTKLELETPYIVALGVQRIEEAMNQYGMENPNILVVGLGPVGIEMQKVLVGKGFSVTSYDKVYGEKNIVELVKNNTQIVIGTTGSQILSHDKISELNKLLTEEVLFISMSSSDREFELWKLRDLLTAKKAIHEDVQFGNIIIANNGFPITFKGRRLESSAEEMERTICLLFAGVVLGATSNNLVPGLIDIPENIVKMIE